MTTTKVSKSSRFNALRFALTVLWPLFVCGLWPFLYSSKEASPGTYQLLIGGIGSLILLSNIYGTADLKDSATITSRVFIAGNMVAWTTLFAVFVPLVLNALSSTWWLIVSSVEFIVCAVFGAYIVARHGVRKLSIATPVAVCGAVFQVIAFLLLAFSPPIIAGITLGGCVLAFSVFLILLMWS